MTVNIYDLQSRRPVGAEARQDEVPVADVPAPSPSLERWWPVVRQLSASFESTAAERDLVGGTPKAERDALRRSGLLSLMIPATYGGLGSNWQDTLDVVLEFA